MPPRSATSARELSDDGEREASRIERWDKALEAIQTAQQDASEELQEMREELTEVKLSAAAARVQSGRALDSMESPASPTWAVHA